MRLLVHIIAIIIPTVRREVDLPRHKMTMRCSGTGGKVTRHGELAAPCRRCGCTVNETISSHVGARHQIRCVVLDPCSVAQILCKRIPITGVKKKKKKPNQNSSRIPPPLPPLPSRGRNEYAWSVNTLEPREGTKEKDEGKMRNGWTNACPEHGNITIVGNVTPFSRIEVWKHDFRPVYRLRGGEGREERKEILVATGGTFIVLTKVLNG